MRGLFYQIKNMRRDKIAILSFLLPIIAGIAISFFPVTNMTSFEEMTFCAVEDNLLPETSHWLQENGNLIEMESHAALEKSILDPTTQYIGVVQENHEIRTILAGDEFNITSEIAEALPRLYQEREQFSKIDINATPSHDDATELFNLLISIILVTAMFMGSTFNAMNIISEKEEGTALVHEITPVTRKQYISQKIILGFVLGFISSVITAIICVKTSPSIVFPILMIIILSTFIASIVGLFIGRLSDGLMVGLVSIKVILIIFIAVPILFYLIVPTGSLLHSVSHLFSSCVTFYGLMNLLNGQFVEVWMKILILFTHCIAWVALYIFVERMKNRPSKSH